MFSARAETDHRCSTIRKVRVCLTADRQTNESNTLGLGNMEKKEVICKQG